MKHVQAIILLLFLSSGSVGSADRGPLQEYSHAKEKLSAAIQRQADILSKFKGYKLKSKEVLSRHATDAWRASIADSLDRLKNADLKVMVVGCVSHGKSSLVNAFLGENVLPSDPGPVSRFSVCVKGSAKSEPSITLHGRSRPIETLRAAVDSALLADSQPERSADPRTVATLWWPKELCPVLQNDVEIWDMAGLDYEEDVDSSVLGHCRKGDVIIVAVDSSSGLSLAVRKFITALSELTVVIAFTKWDLYLSTVTKERAQMTEQAYRARAAQVLHNISCSDPDLCVWNKDLVFFVDSINYLKEKSKRNKGESQSAGIAGMLLLQQRVDRIAAGSGVRTKLLTVWRISMVTSKAMASNFTLLCNNFQQTVKTLRQKIGDLQSEVQGLPDIQESTMILIDRYLNALFHGYMKHLSEVLFTNQRQLKKDISEGIDTDLATRDHLFRLNQQLNSKPLAKEVVEETATIFDKIINLLPDEAREPCAVLLRHANKTIELFPTDCGLAEFKSSLLSLPVYIVLQVLLTLVICYLITLLPPMKGLRRTAAALVICYTLLSMLSFDYEYEQAKLLVSHLDQSLQRNAHRRLSAMVDQNRIQLIAEVHTQLAAVGFRRKERLDEEEQHFALLDKLSGECNLVYSDIQLNIERLHLLLPLLNVQS